jgi:hypothetical protein
MQMTLYGGQNLSAEKLAEVEPVAPGIGRIACTECEGKPEEYPSLFPPEIGVTQCLNCKGLGYIFVDI